MGGACGRGQAVVGTHQIGIKRLREFLDDYELDDIVALSEAIQGKSELALRAAIGTTRGGCPGAESSPPLV